MTEECFNKTDVTKCIRAELIQFMRGILHSPHTYEIPHDIQSNELKRDDILDIAEGNIALLQQNIMKEVRDQMSSVNLGEIGNGVEDTARAALSWLAPGKSS